MCITGRPGRWLVASGAVGRAQPWYSLHALDVDACEQKSGVRSDLIFGPRAGDGVALITAEGAVLWDADKAGKTGQEVEALMHSAVLEKRCVCGAVVVCMGRAWLVTCRVVVHTVSNYCVLP